MGPRVLLIFGRPMGIMAKLGIARHYQYDMSKKPPRLLPDSVPSIFTVSLRESHRQGGGRGCRLPRIMSAPP